MHSHDFGKDFIWGVSTSAFQTEGNSSIDGRGQSIWDVFVADTAHAKTRDLLKRSCDFYNRYYQDIVIMKYLNIRNFRFSLSWPRLMPEGNKRINQRGIDFYKRVIDYCHYMEIEPWITLYHWDLPYELEKKGGWTNRDICNWFADYVELCSRSFGDGVSKWMILNEPLVFTGAGYFLGRHAPGKKGLENFLSAAHHSVLSQAIGARIMKEKSSNYVGTTFSYSHIDPLSDNNSDFLAAKNADTIFNRLFIEPLLGLGYPYNELSFLRKIEKYIQAGDEKLMSFDMDFLGLQTYTREVVSYSSFIPYIKAKLVKASVRNVKRTSMDWEVYPESIYHALKRLSQYKGLRDIIITENGAAFDDQLHNKHVHDPDRIQYLQDHIAQVLMAKNEGIPVKGYFAWSLTDNFEWAEGFEKRFGLVYIDYKTRKRYIKSSGRWYKKFLSVQREEENVIA